MHRSAMSARERALRSRLAQLLHDEILLHATLSVRRVTCGKKGCRCTQGEKHAALYAVCARAGQTRQVFIPQDLEPDVRAWVAGYHRVRELIEELSELSWERVRERKR